MTKIVVNTCYGGFGLSDEALIEIQKTNPELVRVSGTNLYLDEPEYKVRAHPAVVQVVEKLGEEADGFCAQLRIVEIPDDVTDWYIAEYDGVEWIAEGRTWD